ncbi:hypothetical protein ACOBVQ_000369 [Campylobacter coli]
MNEVIIILMLLVAPKWVDSWLINYEKAKVLDEISKSIKPFIK